MAKYLTIPDELLAVAEAAENHFRNLGYKIKVEHRDLAFPYVPAFMAVRTPTCLVVEIRSSVELERLKQWVRYCKSCAKDIRFATCVRHDVHVSAATQAILRGEGIGLYYLNENFVEILAPIDQGLTVQLPALADFKASVRHLLGPSYEKLERGDWRESFADACEAFENEARNHLKRGLKSGRIKILDSKGNQKKITSKEVDKKTIGQLEGEYGQIQNPNYLDSQITQTLAAINPDRIGVVHKKRKGRTEARLRKNVGHLMWTIINALVAMKT